jgi:hypothetical protein
MRSVHSVIGKDGSARRLGLAAVCVLAVAAVAAIIFAGNYNTKEYVAGVDTEEELSEETGILYDAGELDELLSDDTISTIQIPEGLHIILSAVELKKELVVSDGAMLEVGYLNLGAGGQVTVDGILDLQNALLRAEEGTQGVCVSVSGELRCNENTVLWTPNGGMQAISYMNLESATFPGRKIVLDEAAEFKDTVSVSSYEELVAAQTAGNAVRVDGDIHFAEDYSFSTPVYVSKGVTLSAEDDVCLNFDTELLINCGNINAGFSLNDGSILLNFGILGAFLYNIGTLNAYHFYLMGGTCFNYGSIYAKTGDASFTVTNAGRLYNFGSFEAEEDSEVCNNGWVDNAGSFVIGKSALFDNDVFFNRNYFECSITSTINRQSGIYYGSGEFCINGLASVAVWRTADWAFKTDGCEVTSEEELREALKDNEVSQILVSSPIEIAEDIEITKPLLLGAAFTVDDAAGCSLKNTYMVVAGGTLTAKSLTLSNALLVAKQGTVDLTGAVLEMDNRSSFAADEAEVKLSESSISAVQQSVLSLPFAKDSVVADSTIMLEDSWLFFNRNVQLNNTEISLEKDAVLVEE